jgi:hypothetical protein
MEVVEEYQYLEEHEEAVVVLLPNHFLPSRLVVVVQRNRGRVEGSYRVRIRALIEIAGVKSIRVQI